MNSFDTKKEYILENDRVKLRPLAVSDFDHLLPYSLDEPELWEYSLVPANGEENLRNYIQKALTDRLSNTAYPFIVFDKETSTYAGSTRFYDIQNYHQTTQLGFTWYGKNFQGTGLNKNCKLLLLDFAFDIMNMQRVEFRADNKNVKSIAAMKSIGCTKEGVLRSNCNGLTGRRDSIVLSILKSEWENELRSNLKVKLGR